ncbi:DUF3037 domain-containing protein [Sphingomonas albertensis]|uniref:DUF3037 domain-containing protein n=1 Tax=Sphingomonas albertensis TaxID=2762591 RepID=A0ABR7AK01_9SPHN|nr:DUF3037 domain-containing protein [Sphingomonas albertensis]MBC3940779.1 DUF3037 domain-containing protein [Sphingomonas albertensis]
MSAIYQYSIIRFLPFADLGEFANIGIVALDSQNKILEFRLARSRFRRLREFFGEDAYRAYGAAIEHLRLELASFTMSGGFWANWNPERAFSHLTRKHESSIIFSEVRTLLSKDHIGDVVDMLFTRLIERQRQEAHDLDLIKDIRHELVANGIKGFRAIRVVDDVVPVTFPLAHRNGKLNAIQPMVFTQKTPLAVFDHGAMWKRRLMYLLDQGKIEDKSILLAVDPPVADASRSLQSAYTEAMNEIKSLPFEAVTAEIGGRINHRIIEFAEAAAPPRHSFFN